MNHNTNSTVACHISTFAAVLCLGLAGCGGGGGHGVSPNTVTNSTTTITDPNRNLIPDQNTKPTNVALADGRSVSATYDAAHAGVISDGDTTNAYWVGEAQNDAITIALDKTYHISGFTLYTNATNNTDTRIELSSDGTNYTVVNLYGSSGTVCASVDMGNGKIACSLSSLLDASHVRVVITATAAEVANTRIYELEVTGQ